MSQAQHPLAGKPATLARLVDVDRLVAAYYDTRPDATVAAQRVSFGTSGHRGTSFNASFNEAHVLAITQAICEYRAQAGIDGPLFLGIDTHALSKPAQDSALEVLAAHGVETRIAAGGEFTPTPALSHAILCWNRGRESGLADGIVATPSHNPPEDGGFKYNPPNGGPADSKITGWIQDRANALLADGLRGVRRVSPVQARAAATTREFDFLSAYVDDLGALIDFDAIRAANLRLSVRQARHGLFERDDRAGARSRLFLGGEHELGRRDRRYGALPVAALRSCRAKRQGVLCAHAEDGSALQSAVADRCGRRGCPIGSPVRKRRAIMAVRSAAEEVRRARVGARTLH